MESEPTTASARQDGWGENPPGENPTGRPRDGGINGSPLRGVLLVVLYGYKVCLTAKGGDHFWGAEVSVADE